MSNSLKIHLFGQFSTCSEHGLMNSLKAQKAQELFCYLVLYCDRAHHREVLSDVLWRGHKNSRKYLRKTLWQLKRSINTLDESTNHPFLLVDGDWLQINPCANIWVDAQVFEQAYRSNQKIKGSDLNTEEYTHLREVLKLYTGDLFERMYSDWCIFERERFREIYLVITSKLLDYCIANQEYGIGIEYGKKILHADRVHELTHRKLMRLYYLANDRVGAIRQFEECKKCLAEELTVQPSKRTQDLYQWILKDKLPVKSSELPDLPPPAQISSSLKRIRRLMEIQAAIDQRLPQEIQKLEEALSERD